MIKILTICLCVHYIVVLGYSYRQNNDYNSNIKEYLSTFGVIEYDLPQAPPIISSYGLCFSDSRKDFIYSGLELVYGYKPKFIPNRSILENIENEIAYDAGWCYVIATPANVKYDFIVKNFTHKNWMLKLWSRVSESATSQFVLESYEVAYNNRKYTIALKNNNAFDYHKISIIKRKEI